VRNKKIRRRKKIGEIQRNLKANEN
jgi:hypothetical protein